MEEGKIATAWAQFGATERSPSMYIRMRVLPWSNTFVSVGGINFSSLVNQPVVLLVNVQEVEAALGTVGATERDPSMYIRMRVPWSNTFVSVGQVGSISAPLVNQPVVY
jgi:hypothetical protein